MSLTAGTTPRKTASVIPIVVASLATSAQMSSATTQLLSVAAQTAFSSSKPLSAKHPAGISKSESVFVNFAVVSTSHNSLASHFAVPVEVS